MLEMREALSRDINASLASKVQGSCYFGPCHKVSSASSM